MRKLFIIVALVALSSVSYAQWSQSIFNSPNQQMVEDAVKNGIVLIRQDYQLSDTITKQRYGLNHEANFGSQYSIAVKIEKGLSVSNRFVTPWDYDDNYTPYRDSQYIPVMSNTQCRSLQDSNYVEFKYRPENIIAIKDSAVYQVDSLVHPGRGFLCNRETGEKEGWIVWLYVSDSANLAKENISMVTYRQKVTIKEGLHNYSFKQPEVNGQVLGGLYVYPQNTTIGTLEFLFVGLLIPNSGEMWQFYAIGEEPDASLGGEDPAEHVGQESTLTPIEEPQQEQPARNRSRRRNR